MKKLLLLAGAAQFMLCASAVAQSATDNPANYFASPAATPQAVQPPVQNTLSVPCNSPVTSDANVCDSGSVMLSVSNGDTYAWFSGPVGGTPLSTGSTFTTPMLNTTTSYYVESYCNLDTTMMPLPAQAGTYSGNIRGYYFTAPVDFVISGVRVPTDADPGAQTIELLRFTAGGPPEYPGLTNSFTSLGYWNGVNSTSVINTNIQVYAGDIIGVYGWRGTTDSYSAGGSFVSDIAGNPVTLERTGMQYDLNAQQMFDVWSETGGSISRTELYYTIPGDTSVRVMSTVYVNASAAVNDTVAICAGDSVYAGGAYQTAAGTYIDSMQTFAGCDSVITTMVMVNALPSVTVAAFPMSTVCLDDAVIALPAGTPAGGTFSGTGVSGTDFDPMLAGAGTYDVIYTYTDSLGCTAQDTTTITVDLCMDVAEANGQSWFVYPNPASGVVNIQLQNNQSSIQITDASGRVVMPATVVPAAFYSLDVSAFAKGLYFITVKSENGTSTKPLTIQ
jgi:hypothetical protein